MARNEADPGFDQGDRLYFEQSQGDLENIAQKTDSELKRREIEKASDQISRTHLLTYAGLNKYRTVIDETKFHVDMWLPPRLRGEIEAISNKDAIEILSKNKERINEIGVANLPNKGFDFIEATEESSIAFLQEEIKMEEGQEKSDYKTYHERVNKIIPFRIPQDAIDLSRFEVLEEASKMGIKFSENDESSVSEALNNYFRSTRKQTKEEVESLFKRFAQKHRVKIGEIIGQDLDNIRYPMRWEESKGFWMMWERVTSSGNYLRANWHRKHRRQWNEGRIELYSIHEPAHFYFGHMLKDQINKGKLDQAVGVFTIPGPGCYQLEGIAQTLGDLASLDVSSDGRLAIKLYRLERRALVNGLMDVEEGADLGETATKLKMYMPLKTKEDIEEDLQDGTTKPFERAYLPIYGWSDYDFMELKERFGDRAIENVVLPNLMNRPYTRGDLIHPRFDLPFLKRNTTR